MMSDRSFRDHPLSRARWIWPGGELYLQNCHAQFRFDFHLDKLPGRAPLCLTADQSYRLYINGSYVCRGPARGYQSSWPFDELDVAPFLREGHNWFSVEAYNPGIGTFQYIHQSAAGFLCAAEWGEVSIHTNRREWKMRRSPGNRPGTARLSIQMGFQEDFDTAEDDLSWITSPESPDWEMKDYELAVSETPFGRPPWSALEPRGIPMLREKPLAPSGITVYGQGIMKEGWRTCKNIAWHWAGDEEKSVVQWMDPGDLQMESEGEKLRFSVPPAMEGGFIAVCVDLGAIRTGSFSLGLENCSGGEIADCLFFQYLEHGIPETRIPVGNGGQLALATRLRTAEGSCGREFFSIFGARYVVLIFRGFRRAVRSTVSWRSAEYPFRMRGVFSSSDRELDSIWNLCRHTQQICATDAYIDTPWREQGQWWADARIQARNTVYLDGDLRLFHRGIDCIAAETSPNGLVSGVAPCRGGGCILPDFALTWVLSIWDSYWQTGSLEMFEKHLPRIQQIFHYFETPENRTESGVLKFDPFCWLFEDWAPLPKEGCPAFLNLWHLHALRHYEKLLRASGRIREADASAAECRFRADLLEQTFFDREEGLFLAGRTPDGQALGVPSVHDQVLAILNGLCPDAWKTMAERRILPFLRDEPLTCARPSSFWCTYLFDAAEQLSLGKETLSFLRRHWARMVPSGGTWEHLEWNPSEGQSCCHAWSAHPVVHLPNLLLGLRQLAPAWQEISLRPDPELLPESGTILLPLPPGDLTFSWRNGLWDIRYPGKYHLQTGEKP